MVIKFQHHDSKANGISRKTVDSMLVNTGSVAQSCEPFPLKRDFDTYTVISH